MNKNYTGQIKSILHVHKSKLGLHKLNKINKSYFVQQAITKKKCTTKIVQSNRSTAIPTYIGIMVHYKKDKEDRMQFYFCNDDIERYVKGIR
jgi:hypothetical protein